MWYTLFEMKSVFKVLSRKREGKNWIGKPRRRWRNCTEQNPFSEADSSSIPFPTALQPGVGLGLFKSFLHPSRFRATTVQFLHPSFAASSFTPSFQRNLGLPLVRFPPGSMRRTLPDKSLSSWRMTCPAHLNLLRYRRHVSPGHWGSQVPIPRQGGGTSRGGQFLS